MNRFFVEPSAISGTSVAVPDAVSYQIRRVLRLKDGEKVQFLDNSGWVYDSEIHYSEDGAVSALILNKHFSDTEPYCRISLYIALTQREKFEWILQKCTEAGIARIVPMITERTLIRKASDISGKLDRWEKILKEAAEQCGRGRIPEITPAITFEQACTDGKDADLAIFCWEAEKQNSLHEAISPIRDNASEISIMIGPEGGFSDEEAEKALQNGWKAVTLGKRIYRMETAAMAAVILTLYEIEQSE